jgi:hypothetical protein
MTKGPRGALTAQEFFAREFDGGSRMDAVRGALLSLPSVQAAATGKSVGRHVATSLQAWSLLVPAAVVDRSWISAARTMGIAEPSPKDLRAPGRK